MTLQRKIGPFSVNPVGLGCMPLSHGYGAAKPDDYSVGMIQQAIDLGYDFLDTAAVYGAGHNESVVGRALKGRRDKVVLASKCGLGRNADGSPLAQGSPAAIAKTLDDSLTRLDVDHIDLYYLHRPDPQVPIEESVGALARAVEAGKIGAIGLSEISTDGLRRGAAAHPIAALQTEYSLWTRNPEIALLDACRELGTTFVAFSPVGRGFLADAASDPTRFEEGDMRRIMPRFHPPHLAHNIELLGELRAMAEAHGATPAQMAIAWLLHVEPSLVTIPGTTSIAHAEENLVAGSLVLGEAEVERLGAAINQETVSGSRYAPAMQAMVTTEDF